MSSCLTIDPSVADDLSFGPPPVRALVCAAIESILHACPASARAHLTITRAGAAVPRTAGPDHHLVLLGQPGGATDWSEVPLAVAAALAPLDDATWNTAATAALEARNGAVLISLARTATGFTGRARCPLQCVESSLGAFSGVFVDVPATFAITAATAHAAPHLVVHEPDADARRESLSWLRQAVHTGAIAPEGSPHTRGATHAVVVDAAGRRRVRRLRFAGDGPRGPLHPPQT